MKRKTRTTSSGCNRSTRKFDPVCHWCKAPLTAGVLHQVTTAKFSEFPALPSGVGVAVCGKKCPNRPEAAPVGRFTGGN
jgi:hypothetical protein